MKRSSIIFLVVAVGVKLSAACPGDLEGKVESLHSFFADRAKLDIRVELSGIARDHFVDPPLNESDFPARATLSLTISSLECVQELRSALKLMLDSGWSVSKYAGYPRWSFSVIGAAPNDFRLLIDEENSLVSFAGTWYQVDRSLIECLTGSFLRFAENRFGDSRSRRTGPSEKGRAAEIDPAATKP